MLLLSMVGSLFHKTSVYRCHLVFCVQTGAIVAITSSFCCSPGTHRQNHSVVLINTVERCNNLIFLVYKQHSLIHHMVQQSWILIVLKDPECYFCNYY